MLQAPNPPPPRQPQGCRTAEGVRGAMRRGPAAVVVVVRRPAAEKRAAASPASSPSSRPVSASVCRSRESAPAFGTCGTRALSRQLRRRPGRRLIGRLSELWEIVNGRRFVGRFRRKRFVHALHSSPEGKETRDEKDSRDLRDEDHAILIFCLRVMEARDVPRRFRRKSRRRRRREPLLGQAGPREISFFGAEDGFAVGAQVVRSGGAGFPAPCRRLAGPTAAGRRPEPGPGPG